MNKLREKLAKLFDGLRTETLNDLEQITDDFSVNFLDWFEKNVNQLIDMNYIYKGLIYTDKTELLQIFKTQVYGKE